MSARTVDWQIHPREADLSRVYDPVSLWSSLVLVERRNLPDSWIVTGPASALSVFEPGMGCVLDREGDQVTSGRVRSIKRRSETTERGTTDLMTVAFVSDLARLNGRVIFPDPTHQLTEVRSHFPDAKTHDQRSGAIEDLILHYVDVSMGPSALVNRRQPRLRLPLSGGRGGSTTVTARNDDLGVLVHDLAEAGGLVVNVRHAEPGPWLDLVIEPERDLSADVRFGSPESGAVGLITDWDYELEEPMLTRAYVAGDGEMAGRWYLQIIDADAEDLWKTIDETLVDQNSAGSQDELLRGGQKALAEGAGPTRVAFTPVLGPDTEYRRDVRIGDVVGYDLPGLDPGKDAIRQVTTTVTNNKGTATETVAVVVGTPDAQESRSQRKTASALRGITVIQGSK